MQDYVKWQERFARIESLLEDIGELSRQQRDFAEAALWEKEGMYPFQRWQKQRDRLVQQLGQRVIRPRDEALLQGDKLQAARREHERRCRELIALIKANDAVTANCLKEGMDGLTARLAGIRRAQKARQAYYQTPAEGARFFDKKN